jgi:hypothetical protein
VSDRRDLAPETGIGLLAAVAVACVLLLAFLGAWGYGRDQGLKEGASICVTPTFTPDHK